MVFVAGAAAQNLIIKKFYHAERDFTANSGSTLILDANEEPCALIKVRTNESGFWFDSGRLLPIEKTEEQTQKHPGEIYVWVQSGAKRLSLGHKHWVAFMTTTSEHTSVPVLSKQVRHIFWNWPQAK